MTEYERCTWYVLLIPFVCTHRPNNKMLYGQCLITKFSKIFFFFAKMTQNVPKRKKCNTTVARRICAKKHRLAMYQKAVTMLYLLIIWGNQLQQAILPPYIAILTDWISCSEVCDDSQLFLLFSRHCNCSGGGNVLVTFFASHLKHSTDVIYM